VIQDPASSIRSIGSHVWWHDALQKGFAIASTIEGRGGEGRGSIDLRHHAQRPTQLAAVEMGECSCGSCGRSHHRCRSASTGHCAHSLPRLIRERLCASSIIQTLFNPKPYDKEASLSDFFLMYLFLKAWKWLEFSLSLYVCSHVFFVMMIPPLSLLFVQCMMGDRQSSPSTNTQFMLCTQLPK
jgi:hypothetical protein